MSIVLSVKRVKIYLHIDSNNSLLREYNLGTMQDTDRKLKLL